MRYPFILISGISVLSLCASALCAETRQNNQSQPVVIPTDQNQPTPTLTQAEGKPFTIPDIIWSPQRGEADRTRIVSGGTRETIIQNPVHLAVLTPEHMGLSSIESPTLHWFISKIVERPLELTITARQSVTPVLEVRLKAPVHAGIQAIRLNDYRIRLQPEVEYQWCIRMVSDANQTPQNQDVVSYGGIIYRKAPTELSQQWQQASPEALPALYAKKGYWYDALMAISSLVDKYPEHRAIHEQRTSLLEQVKLNTVISLGQTLSGLDHP